MAKQKQVITVEGRELAVSNLEKVLWPASNISKAELINYHLEMAPITLNYWSNRPLTVTRYPDGIEQDFFYQKNCPDHAPSWVKTLQVTSENKAINYILPNDLPTLVWLANQGSIEFHPTTATADDLTKPSFAIIDLDPTAPQGFEDARRVASYTKTILDQLNLRGYPKTSGATGIHIYIPIEPIYNYSDTGALVEFIGKLLVKFYPKEVTNERLVKNRIGVYVDHLQNSASKTIAGVYSPRPLPHAPVSTPFSWDELSTIQPEELTLRTVVKRVSTVGDLFAPVLTDLQRLEHVLPLISQV